MNELVSVVMPCYNDSKYLKEAVDSVLGQSYPNVELIIIDDGSDDAATLADLKELAEKDNVRVLFADHGGPSAARNFGIAQANGSYILPVDSDDRIAPDYIAKAVPVLQSDDNIGIVYCRAELFGERSGPWDLGDFSMARMLVRNQIFVSALFRKADWQAVGGFAEQYKSGIEDYDFWLSILELGRSVVRLDEVLFFYRIKPVSRTTKLTDDQSQAEQMTKEIYSRHKALYEKHSAEYIEALRQEISRLEAENNALRKSLSFISKLNKNPLIHKLSVWIKGKM